ncbi:type II secretion system F family protein [Pseudomonas sp. FP833]|uniref:type II secretion system F family protein n=1 Tax=Pseudomonas sp. FP833 TaxID=2954102 RepID=UPI002736A37F|nr:type II secretion system F family protein [Pseudomonas sp. FP833]WLI52194.1 type II secretion system F family protein [Pseudomonas sp. FP833]
MSLILANGEITTRKHPPLVDLQGPARFDLPAEHVGHAPRRRRPIERLKHPESQRLSLAPERIDAIHYGVSSGKDFGTALKLAGHQFADEMAIHFLQVLATRQGFAKSMERFANRWLEQMLKRVEAISKSLTALSAVFMGLLVIFVMVGIFQLAVGLMDSIQR